MQECSHDIERLQQLQGHYHGAIVLGVTRVGFDRVNCDPLYNDMWPFLTYRDRARALSSVGYGLILLRSSPRSHRGSLRHLLIRLSGGLCRFRGSQHHRGDFLAGIRPQA
jgi:hypothetical protein